MTDEERRQEIREGLADQMYRSDYCGRELKEFIDLPVYLQNLYIAQADESLAYLNSKCMIKVEKELPFPMCTIRMNDPRYQDGAMIHAQKLMLEAGYVYGIPLV